MTTGLVVPQAVTRHSLTVSGSHLFRLVRLEVFVCLVLLSLRLLALRFALRLRSGYLLLVLLHKHTQASASSDSIPLEV